MIDHLIRIIRSVQGTFSYRREIAEAFYGIACIHSLRGDGALSLHFLEKSLRGGFNDFNMIDNNSDLRTVRDNLGWEGLMQRYS